MRKLTALVLATILGFALVGCTSSNSDEEGVSTEAQPSSGNESSGNGSSAGNESTGDGGSSSGDATTDGSDLSDFLPDGTGDCLEVSLTYGSIYLTALGIGSDADRQELQDQIDQIKGEVPADIQDDMQTIADGIANADGLVELGQFFESEEYTQADENITRFLEETCPDGGGSSGN